jgi:uncharacterized protein YgbK (DUF1537 family)
MMGLAACLHDAAALAEAFGPGAELRIGAAGGDIFAPSGPFLTESEMFAATRGGAESYFLAFGNAAQAEPAYVAPLIERLAAAAGTGFVAACLAAPWRGRTVFQGHMFEGVRHLGDAAEALAAALGQPVGKITHETVRAGAAAVKRACTGLKEQGRLLALIDAIDDADCAVITEALRGMPATGGAAWLAARPHAPEPAQPAGRLAILSGAGDRATNLQIGALRGMCEVYELDLAAENPLPAAQQFARGQSGPVVISAPPLRAAGAPVAPLMGQLAAFLLTLGVQKFIVTGGETGRAVLEALGARTLVAGAAMGPLRWLHGTGATFCFKPAGIGGRNLFLSEVEPQIRLNAEASSGS